MQISNSAYVGVEAPMRLAAHVTQLSMQMLDKKIGVVHK